MAEVRLEGICKRYGRHEVLKDLSITIKDRECFTFLGPSGCGKTVILRQVAGFENPDKGQIFIGDTLVASGERRISLPPETRKISVVFQDYAVWPHRTVFENVAYPLHIQRVPKGEVEERTREAISQVGLAGLEKRMPYQLSGGQQQRVALARALVSRPQVMLLDEPLNNLDANLREEMRFEIKELQRKFGVTILYVTHDQDTALVISDRIAILDKNGKIRQVGSPREVYENPVDAFVFKFMGVANLVPVQVHNDVAYVQGTEMQVGRAIPAQLRSAPRIVMAFRPMDAELSRSPDGLEGVVKRVTFLGATLDYLITVGPHEVRVEQDTHEAIANGLVFSEGETCHLRLCDVKWFDADSLAEEVSA
ncbi:MAG TPA: ABC transporter ATP-binding protein [Firmicutes bacterium]|nr:ABC transporter ATP-binding protein [Bacillota bacterium]